MSERVFKNEGINESLSDIVDLCFQRKLLKIKTQRACFRFLWAYLSEKKQDKALEILYLGYRIEQSFYDEQ